LDSQLTTIFSRSVSQLLEAHICGTLRSAFFEYRVSIVSTGKGGMDSQLLEAHIFVSIRRMRPSFELLRQILTLRVIVSSTTTSSISSGLIHVC
jgi:hypothetical protein